MRLEYDLPRRLEADRETRSNELVTVTIETTATLYADVKRIDFVTVRTGTPVVSAEVPSDPSLLAASDHRPVVATVRLSVP